MRSRRELCVWLARLAIVLVVGWNLECAVSFLVHPQYFAPSFELDGIGGEAAVRGVGILFVMWNIPYLVALWHPLRHRLSLGEAWGMQLAGLIGETWLLTTLPGGHLSLRTALQRFVWFDAAGLLALTLACWLVIRAGAAITPRP